jgi:hypothetical protein
VARLSVRLKICLDFKYALKVASILFVFMCVQCYSMIAAVTYSVIIPRAFLFVVLALLVPSMGCLLDDLVRVCAIGLFACFGTV